MTLEMAVLAVGAAGVAAALARSSYLRRNSRDPRELIHIDASGSSPTTVIGGMDDYLGARIALAYFAALFLLAGIETWSSVMSTAIFMFGVALYLALGFWVVQTGRFGDGGVRLTAEGLVQHARGVEQRVRWDDIGEMITIRNGAVIDAGGKASFRRWVPRAWAGRWPASIEGTDTVWLRNQNLHRRLRDPLIEAIGVWSTDEFARHEIGTEAATQRLLDAVARHQR